MPLLSDLLKDASFINEVKGVKQVTIDKYTNTIKKVNSGIPLNNLRDTVANNVNDNDNTDGCIRVTNNRQKKKEDKHRVVTILGDSMSKDLRM